MRFLMPIVRADDPAFEGTLDSDDAEMVEAASLWIWEALSDTARKVPLVLEDTTEESKETEVCSPVKDALGTIAFVFDIIGEGDGNMMLVFETRFGGFGKKLGFPRKAKAGCLLVVCKSMPETDKRLSWELER